jgi:pilus assembly protein CpaF
MTSRAAIAQRRAALRTTLLVAVHAGAGPDAMEDMSASRDAREAIVRCLLERALAAQPTAASAGIDTEALLLEVLLDAIGYGPIDPLLFDPAITEIMVNAPHAIFIEREGRIEPAKIRFANAAHLEQVIQRIVLDSGRRVDTGAPILDARLPTGARVNVVLPPIARGSPIITIRTFRPRQWQLEELVDNATLTAAEASQLAHAVASRENLLIIGGTGSGKTTLLGALSSAMRPEERIITIEDTAELRLPIPHVVSLEIRRANIEGRGAITIRDLVRTALRMRPDRIIVGECRGSEALDMLQAMQTGHDGSMTTLHANSAREAIHRLATLVAMADVPLSLDAIYAMITAAIDGIVAIQRTATGARRVMGLYRVAGHDVDSLRVLPWEGDVA